MADLRTELEKLFKELGDREVNQHTEEILPGFKQQSYEYRCGAVAGVAYGIQDVIKKVGEILKRHETTVALILTKCGCGFPFTSEPSKEIHFHSERCTTSQEYIFDKDTFDINDATLTFPETIGEHRKKKE